MSEAAWSIDSTAWIAATAAGVVSAVAVGVVRSLALRARMLDTPNHRSSHARPTPRGGGLGLLIGWVVGAALTAASADWRLVLAFVGLVPVAFVGWLDDRGGLPVRVRLAAHLLCALAAAPLALDLPGGPLLLPWWLFCLVAGVNVVNFLDGIDGLVAGQILLAAVHLALFGGTVLGPAAGLAGACAGFLLWNRPPARIFLGDVGSGTLGAAITMLGFVVLRERAVSPVVVFLPLLPMCLDASVTLWRRWRAGQRLTEAHRLHLYQRIANAGVGHGPVTAAYALAALLAVPAQFAGAAWTAAYCAVSLLVYYFAERRWPFMSNG